MEKEKGFAPIAMVLIIIAVLAVGGVAYYAGTKNNSISQNIPENIVGGDKDEHGCIGSAGYTWCVIKNKCLRTWEEKCEIAPNQDKTFSETEIITSLKANWQSIQALIPFRPGHPGTVAWNGPYSVQFIGKNNLLVNFEDGYNPGIAILNFDGNKFKILETFKNQGNFTLSDWQNLVKKYGDSSYPVNTYTISLVRNKEIVSFQDLTKVSENIFLKNY